MSELAKLTISNFKLTKLKSGENLTTLSILCEIWKTGADVVLQGNDLDLIDYENTPKAIIETAIQNSESIEAYLKSWQGETKLNEMMMQGVKLFCGWQHNEKLNTWLCSDEKALLLFDEWCIQLGKNGWSIYEDFRKYETDESNKIKLQFFEQAKACAKRGYQ